MSRPQHTTKLPRVAAERPSGSADRPGGAHESAIDRIGDEPHPLSKLAKDAFKSGRTIRELALERATSLLPDMATRLDTFLAGRAVGLPHLLDF